MDTEKLEGLMQSTLEFDYLRFTYADLCGGSRGLTIPRRNVSNYLKDGIGVHCGKSRYFIGETRAGWHTLRGVTKTGLATMGA